MSALFYIWLGGYLAVLLDCATEELHDPADDFKWYEVIYPAIWPVYFLLFLKALFMAKREKHR